MIPLSMPPRTGSPGWWRQALSRLCCWQAGGEGFGKRGKVVSMNSLMLILASVTISALAQIAFKLGLSSKGGSGNAFDVIVAKLTTPGVLIGLALYGGGTLLWLTALDRVDLSQAYPF